MHSVTKCSQAFLLALPQSAGQIDNGVAADCLPHCLQGRQNLLCQRPRARPKLPYFGGTRVLQSLRNLLCQGLPKQGCELWRGDKIAAIGHITAGQCAKFAQIIGVIPQARRIQSLRHEGVKRQPAARLHDGCFNVGLHGCLRSFGVHR